MSAARDSSTNRERSMIYVRLLDEGVPVLRPVPARQVGDNTFRLERPSDYDPDDETWEFPPGSVVRCRPEEHDGDMILVAVAMVEG